MGAHHDEALAEAALQMAVAVRGGNVAGVVFHTDRGSEYTAGDFRAACARIGVTQSMGRPGSALDNAAAESLFSSLEFELLRGARFAGRDAARAAAWIDDYNTERLHTTVGMFCPVEYEQQAAAARQKDKEAA